MPIENNLAQDFYHGAPLKLIFAFTASILALALSEFPPLAFLACLSLLWSSRHVKSKTLLKAHLFLLVFLIICLVGSAFIPTLGGPSASQNQGISVKMAVLPSLRVMISLNMTLALVLSTPVDALARLVAALKLPNVLFVPLTIIFRFVGTFFIELVRVREALLSRVGI
ncbi:MAG: energy-coupling factor transporter transmembrane protein EcfT, partial [Deltaproteobacteria bacterium]|nr:energy-coupling factor transporter transmembrane protein EcfT [Deltaproteobacteria bacterium]